MHGVQAGKKNERIAPTQPKFWKERKNEGGKKAQRSGSMLCRHPKGSKLRLFTHPCSSQKEPRMSMVRVNRRQQPTQTKSSPLKHIIPTPFAPGDLRLAQVIVI
jgi:hypothetical protein